MRYISKKTIGEALLIILAASIFGFLVNIFHPRSVEISTSRPPLEFAADDVPAVDLPQASIPISPDSPKIGAENPAYLHIHRVVELMKTEQAILLDARIPEHYERKHIKTSINMPFADLDAYDRIIPELPEDKWLICYCDGPQCDLSESLAYDLLNFGFTKVAVFEGGMEKWDESNMTLSSRK
ncbi:hypothetical protein GF337_14650 [candidate division KSB1 bacterium]|nr:hypothetical protein [candidate division KSB1 bacterium]